MKTRKDIIFHSVMTRKRAIIICLLTLTFSFSAQAQLETSWWYFGNGAGIHFTENGPMADTSSNVYYGSDCSSTMSDSLGNLQFYFGGNKLWNSQHEVMPNGNGLIDLGGESNCLLTIPRPNHKGQYFVIGNEAGGVLNSFSSHGLFYHLVDMSLDSGLGDVVDSLKNHPVYFNLEEKLAATMHANGEDYWVASRIQAENKMALFAVTEEGIDTVPIMTSMGVASYNYPTIEGALVFSSDSKYLVHLHLNGMEIYDFDNVTGTVSNLRSINMYLSGGDDAVFSTDNTKLYTAGPIQYDLTIPTQSAIQASEVWMGGTFSSSTMTGFQIGIDGKIYGNTTVNGGNCNYLDVINNPNAAGISCNYQDSAIYLLGRNGRNEVPKFPSNFSRPNFQVANSCVGDSIGFWPINFIPDSTYWDFGDPGSGPNNTSNDVEPYHIYSSTGTYTVTLIAQNGVLSDTVTKNITILGLPSVSLGTDTFVCSPIQDSIELIPITESIEFSWSTGSTDSSVFVTEPGTYSVTVTNQCGAAADSIELVVPELPVASLFSPDSMCNGDTLFLDATQPNVTYLWSDGSSSGTYWSTQSGIYSVTVYGICDTVSDSTQVEFYDCPWPEGVEQFSDDDFLIYPNPNSGSLYIRSAIGNGRFEILNLCGQTLIQYQFTRPLNDVMFNHSLPAGSYFYRFRAEEGVYSGLIQVQ